MAVGSSILQKAHNYHTAPQKSLRQMNIPRFFIAPEYINAEAGTVICQDAKLTKQIRKVLRLGNGDKIDLLDGQHNLYHCVLEIPAQSKDRNLFQARIESVEKIINSLDTKIIVALPLIKLNRFEWALEKLTELGIDTIAPVALERSIIKHSDQSEYKQKFVRWQKIIQEASEQCERSRPPKLLEPSSFGSWLDTLGTNHQEHNKMLRIICAERLQVEPLEQVLYNQESAPEVCAIALGAEGGFTETEIEAALSQQFIPVSLGARILRSETAAIYTVAIASTLLRLKSAKR